MAQIINAAANQVKLNNGQLINAQQGGWYDGQQYWGGTLSNPGQINPQSNQQGAGKAVSQQVVAQTAPQNVPFVNEQRAQVNLPPAPDATNATPVQTEQVINPNGLDLSSGNPGAATGGDGGYSATGGVGGNGAGTGIGGVGIAPPAAIDLPSMYQGLYEKEGIADLEKQIADKTQSFNDAQAKINDNPYLSEADRVGRVQKLQIDFDNNVKSVQDQVAMKKQDVQTQLDLATKQFDINSQAAQQSMSQFQALLSSGALDNANGSDIANLTRATGMSSGMIQAAIAASKEKNSPSQVISFDDGTNQGFAIIDPKTGTIIKKQVIAGSKPPASTRTSDGKVTAADNKAMAMAQLPNDLRGANGKAGMTLGTAMSFYEQFGLTPQEIYNQYKAVNYYKATPAQQKADKKKYNVK